MTYLRQKYESSPEYARVAPFAVFVVLTTLQGQFGPASAFWLYLVKTLVGAWMLWEARPFIAELRFALSWEAVAVGVGIFAVWVGLDGLYPRLSEPGEGWNPHQQFGTGSATAWFFIVARIAGTAIVVPPVEELFYRSFLYRYFVKLDFRAMPFNRFHALSFIVTSCLFGFMHPDRWLAGVLCGFAYQWLVVSKNRLGDAMTAHGITNLLLGIWVASRDAWNFW